MTNKKTLSISWIKKQEIITQPDGSFRLKEKNAEDTVNGHWPLEMIRPRHLTGMHGCISTRQWLRALTSKSLLGDVDLPMSSAWVICPGYEMRISLPMTIQPSNMQKMLKFNQVMLQRGISWEMPKRNGRQLLNEKWSGWLNNSGSTVYLNMFGIVFWMPNLDQKKRALKLRNTLRISMRGATWIANPFSCWSYTLRKHRCKLNKLARACKIKSPADFAGRPDVLEELSSLNFTTTNRFSAAQSTVEIRQVHNWRLTTLPVWDANC
jgi:hypothetical protein